MKGGNDRDRRGARRIRGRVRRPLLERLEPRRLLSTFRVDSAADFEDADLSDGACGDFSQACTLRAAIDQANHDPDRDTILFAPGLPTIYPGSPLPPITEEVTVDGYDGSGAARNTNPSIDLGTNAQLTVEIDGSLAGGGAVGLEIHASRTLVTGLVINNFGDYGVYINGGEQNEIQGNFIGTDRTGTQPAPTRSGVAVENADDNLIGGTEPAQRNVLSGNRGEGVILVDTASDNRIRGNYIGTDRTGTQPVPNFQGLLLTSFVAGEEVYASDNWVGGTEPGAGNVISGNERYGVFVLRGDRNKIEGNLIGTDARGMDRLPNGRAGVRIVEGSENVVGGSVPGAGNVISGNGRSGIVIIAGDLFEDTPNPPAPNTNRDAFDNEILGNLIGTDAGGRKPLPNLESGILLQGGPIEEVSLERTMIGGPIEEERNVVSGNGEAGITITGETATANVVLGNYIGTDVTGRITDPNGIPDSGDELGNTHDGIVIDGSPANVIGGLVESARNLVSGNRRNGIRVSGKSAARNEILGNAIGVNELEIASLPNGLDGILVDNAPGTRIGDAQFAEAGNVVAGNRRDGIRVQGPDATGIVVENNDVGVSFLGLGFVGNARHGLSVTGDAHDNLIGGSQPSAGNRIVGNGFAGAETGHGVVIESGTGNRIQRNSIHNNKGLGIDLGGDGPTLNDDDDDDPGANRLQNFATLETELDAGKTKVTGTLKSTPNSTFVIEFFSNAIGGPLDAHEGQTFLDTIGVSTDAQGEDEFSIEFDGVLKNLSATVTDLDGNTSEFSRAALVHGVEFTQAIQVYQKLEDLKEDLADDATPPMPIVAGKPLALRVYLNQLSDPALVTVEATGPGLTDEFTYLQHRECDETNQRRNDMQPPGFCWSADFVFDPPPGPSTYTVTIKDNQGQARESHEFVVDARLTKSLVIKEVATCDTAPFNPNQCQQIGALESTVNGVDVDGLLREIMPTHAVDIQATWHVILLNMIKNDLNMNNDLYDCYEFGCEPKGWFHTVASKVEELFTTGDQFVSPVSTVRYVGVARPGLPGLGGVGRPRGGVFKTSDVVFTPPTETIHELIAHELGHMLGLQHTNVPVPTSASTAPGCWDTAPYSKSDWPFLTNEIQSLSGPFGTPVPEVGFNVSSGTPVLPQGRFEVMAYCTPVWISPHNYLKLVNALSITTGSASVNGEGEEDDGEFWLVSGEIDEQVVNLKPLYLLETEGPSDAGVGTHRIVVQDADGMTLGERFFAPEASEARAYDGEESVGIPSFSELVPVVPDAARIVLLDPQGAELHRVDLTGAAPVVNVEFAPGGEPLSGAHNVRWSVDDADSEDHTFRVEYSADTGQSWISLGTGLADQEVNLDFDRLPGSDGEALVRVLASDGVNSGHAASQPFSVAFKLPAARIQQPADDSEFDLGANVILRAAGFDMDDGYLDGDSFQWSSDRDGFLGVGSRLLVSSLSEGTHEITLVAADDSGNEVTDRVTISVADRIYIDGDHPGFLRFASTGFEVDEDAGEATIVVERVEGSTGTISVDYATSPGTALDGADYVAASGTLTFEDGQTVGEFSIPIVDNALGDQATKSVQLTLSNPSAATMLVQPSTTELLIRDDELADGTVFVVTNTDNAGAGSLRQAILDANARPGTDFIHFDVPGGQVHSIRPLTPLPVITDPLTIDGYSQPGAQANTLEMGNDARLLIELDGDALGGTANGLDLTAGNSIIRGLVINRFPRSGISVRSGDGNVVQGNFIGTNPSGDAALPNRDGVTVLASSFNLIGGSDPSSRNVISGNDRRGVELIGAQELEARTRCGEENPGAACENLVLGNHIGVAADGILPLGNFDDGVALIDAGDSSIGGIGDGRANVIAFNGGAGVRVYFFDAGTGLFRSELIPGKAGSGNTARGNSIHSNVGLGIDLNGAPFDLGIGTSHAPRTNVSANDPGDRETYGANHLRNYPVLHRVTTSDGATTVEGRLDSAALTSFDLDFYFDVAAHASGYGQGATYLGSTRVTTDREGNAVFNVIFPTAVPDGLFVTATSTDSRGNTSEFSTRIVVGDELADFFVVNSTDDQDDGVCDSTHCSLREAIHGANNHPGTDTIRFDVPGEGVRTIAPNAVLPPMTDPVVVDGYSQPGASPNTLTQGSDATLLIELSGQNGIETGLHVVASDSTIRGLVVNRFFGAGILLQHGGDNTVEGNFVGTSSTGFLSLGNRQGILVENSRGNAIGGADPAARNVVSGNESGLLLFASDRNVVHGNHFGTNVTGLGPIGGRQVGDNNVGIEAFASSGNTIGGTGAGEGNVISAHVRSAIELEGSRRLERKGQSVSVIRRPSRDNTIQGNLIGVGADGARIVRNDRYGVWIQTDAKFNTVGGTEDGAGNVIAFSGDTGIILSYTNESVEPFHLLPTNNAIRGNSIHSSGGPAIDLDKRADEINLVPLLLTLNDDGDIDDGPNRRQNYPVLESARGLDGTTIVTGRLESAPNRAFWVDFYSNPDIEITGYGEAREYLGFTEVTTDEHGSAGFEVTLPVEVPTGRFVVATATDLSGNTSELSARMAVADEPSGPFVVNTTSDFDDGVCDAEHCSLREAIHGANNHPGHDSIEFGISGDGARTIRPTRNLPPLTDPVTIDGYTQPGASPNTLAEGNDAVLLVELDGSAIDTGPGLFGSVGLKISAGDSMVRGLVINGYADAAVVLSMRDGNKIEGNFIGTDPTGTSRPALGAGRIRIQTDGNVVGGTSPPQRNLIAGTVLIQEGSGNLVLGNYVGTDRDGLVALGTPPGTSPPSVFVDGFSNVVGGTLPGAGNVIVATLGLAGDGAHLAQGNLIGTDRRGTATLATGSGVGVQVSTSHNLIGGTETAAGNVISGFDVGVLFRDGFGTVSSHNRLQGNFIGTDVTGSLALGNRGEGIVAESDGNLIGGSQSGAGNVISGNAGDGIRIGREGGTAQSNGTVVQGNWIGTRADGSRPLGNGGHGVYITRLAQDDMIGGTETGAGNTIAHNGGDGVSIQPPDPPFRPSEALGNSILSNSIHSNFGLGIDLGQDGITVNDVQDPDGGANRLQNYPELMTVTRSGEQTTITGSLRSRPDTTYRLEFFSGVALDWSGFGEGERLLGAADVTTDSAGVADFDVTLDVATAADHVVTATATDIEGNTSEFSAPPPDADPGQTADLVVTVQGDSDSILQTQAVVYTIHVQNRGPDQATDVSLLNMLPAGVAFDSATASQGNCGGDSLVVCDLGNLASGESATVQVRAIGTTIGNQIFSVQASGRQYEPDSANNVATAETTVVAAADLSVTNTTGAVDPIGQGSGINYNVTVANHGPSTASGVTMVYTLPEAMTFSFVFGVPAGTCSESERVITCNLGFMAPGAEQTVSISARADQLGVIVSEATVSGNLEDPDEGNNLSTQQNTVVPRAEMSLEMTVDPDPATVGRELEYTLTVFNSGPGEARGVTLVDQLPMNVALDSVTASQGTCSVADGVVSCELGDLPSDASATVVIVVVPLSLGELVNTAELSTSGSRDFFQGDNTSSTNTQVESSAACPGQNPFNRLDVNDDALVLPVDALIVVNHINSHPGDPSVPLPSPPYLDTNCDAMVVPLDVLLVINALNRDDEGPVITAALDEDTGIAGDGITSNPTISGTVVDLTGVISVQVTLDGGAATDVTLDRDGRFVFIPELLLDGSDDGQHTIRITARDARGNSSSEEISFTLDTGDEEGELDSLVAAVRRDQAERWRNAAPLDDRDEEKPATMETKLEDLISMIAEDSMRGWNAT